MQGEEQRETLKQTQTLKVFNFVNKRDFIPLVTW